MDRDAPDAPGRRCWSRWPARPSRWCSASWPRWPRRSPCRTARWPTSSPSSSPCSNLARGGLQHPARPAAGRRPGAAGGGLGGHRRPAPRHRGRRLGRPACVAVGTAAVAALLAVTGCLLPVRAGVHAAGRAHPLAGRRPGHPAGPDQPPVPADRPARLARPVFPVPSRHPAGRGAAAGAPRPAGRARRSAVADSSGRLVGLVDRAAADAVPAERRPWVAVDTVARGLDGVPALPAGLGRRAR